MPPSRQPIRPLDHRIAVRRHHTTRDQILQVGQHGITRGTHQARVDADVDGADHGGNIRFALGQAMQDRGFAGLAVAGEETHEAAGVGNGRAVAGEISVLLARSEALQRGHIVDHRPIRRRHNGGGPAHHVIADEHQFSLWPGERDVVGGVAGGEHGFERPALAMDQFAVAQLHIGFEIAVGTGFGGNLLALVTRPRGAVRAFGINGSAGGGLDPRRVRRVVLVGVGDQDVRHALATHRVQQRLRMRRVVRPGIDDRHLAAADDIADRAGEGERRGIVAEHAPHTGEDFLDHPGLERKVAVEEDVVGVGGVSHENGSGVRKMSSFSVMPGLVPGIHVFLTAMLLRRGWPGQARP